MEMTFSELSDLIEASAWRVSEVSGFDETALAAEELLGQAGALGRHTSGYARIAWCLDMACFLVMTLFLYGALLPEGSTPGIFQAVFGLLRISDMAGYLRVLLILLLLPVVFDLILSAICKRTLVTVPPARPRSRGSNVMQRIKNALYDAQGELNPTTYLPAWTVYVVGAVFMLSAARLLYSTVAAKSTIKVSVVLAAVFLFFFSFLLFVAILWVKLFVLSLCFSSGDCKRELNELLEEVPDYEEEFQEIEAEREAKEAEERLLADLKEGEELYRRATAETTVNKVLLTRAAEKGDPRANLEIGKKMVENTDGLNRREVAARYADAKKHFRIADEAGLPDGILMYASARLMTEAHDTMGWLNILRRLRSVERIEVSMKLRTFYTNVRDQLIERVKIAMAHAESEE